MLSDLRNQAQGPVIELPKKLAFESNGRILLLDDGNKGTVNLGGLVAVDPNTGNRTLISNFLDQNQGPLIYNARNLAVGTMPAFVGGSGNGGSTSAPALAGQPFSFDFYFNAPAAAFMTNVKLSYKPPKKTKLVSAVPNRGKCAVKAQIVCNFGTVASSTNFGVRITAIRAKPGVLKNTAVLTYKMVRPGTKKKKSYRLVSSKSITVN